MTLDFKNNLLRPLKIFFTFNYVTFLWIFLVKRFKSSNKYC